MEIKENLYYSQNHEWVRLKGDKAYIGITDYAQEQLGDIVFIELPETGDQFSSGEEIGVIESVKAVSEIYTPVSGEILETNTKLLDDPELLNQKSYESWIITLELEDESELDQLLSAIDYESYCEGEE